MLKRLFKDSFVYTVASVLAKGVTLFTLPIATYNLTQEEYGVLDFCLIFINLAGALLGFELQEGLARFTPKASFKEKQSLVSTTLWCAVFIHIVVMIILFVFITPLSNFLTNDSDSYRSTIIIIILLIFFIKLDYILKCQLRCDLKSMYFAITNIVYALVFGGSIYLTLEVFKLGLLGYLLSLSIATLISLVMVLIPNRKYIVFQFSKNDFNKLFKYSYPLIFSNLIVILSTFTDRVVIKEMLNWKELGIYGIAARFASFGGLFIVGVENGLLPIVYHEYEKEETPTKLSVFFNGFVLLSLIIITASALFGKETLVLMTNESYYQAFSSIPILTAAVLFGGMYVFAVGIMIKKKTKLHLYVSVISVVINLILSVIFISIWGAIGAPIATLVASVVSFIAFMSLSQKLYPVNHTFNRLIGGVVLTTILCFIIISIDMPFIIDVKIIAIKTIVILLITVVLSLIILRKSTISEFTGRMRQMLKRV